MTLTTKSSDVSKYTRGLSDGDYVITEATSRSSLSNREPIADIIEQYLIGPKRVFEVGTGTADQAVYFCERFPQITWQSSDRKVYHSLIKKTVLDAKLTNKQMLDPVEFDIDTDKIQGEYDIIYASNVIHCIPWNGAQKLFTKASSALKVEGLFILYGPYNIKDLANIDGLYTSVNNQGFDRSLKAQDPDLGLREVGEVTALAESHGFVFHAKHPTPKNNYILVFKKVFESNR